MTDAPARLTLRSPRVLGILLCGFLSLFAVDSFTGHTGFVDSGAAFIIHVAPAVLLFRGCRVLAMRGIGGVIFIGGLDVRSAITVRK